MPCLYKDQPVSEKHFISAQQLLDDAFELGLKVLDSGFRPNFIVGVWRGGTPVGIAVQEVLDYFGSPSDHIAIRTSSYDGVEQRARQIRVHGLSYIVKNVNAEDSVLIVDDVWDTGLSIEAVIEHLREESRRNMPQDIRVATAYFKPSKNMTSARPDYFVHETDRWLVFPHELHGLTSDEIVAHKPGIGAILERIRPPVAE